MSEDKCDSVTLYLLKEKKNRLSKTPEYKKALSLVQKVKRIYDGEQNDDDICIVVDDLPTTNQIEFVREIVNACKSNPGKVVTFSGYSFIGVENGSLKKNQEIRLYDRMPFTPRFKKNDHGDVLVDVLTRTCYACSGRTLRLISSMSDIVSVKDVSVSCSDMNMEIVCIDPGNDWSGLPFLNRDNLLKMKMDSDDNMALFIYNGWHAKPDTKTPYNADTVAVIITTHNRTETAITTIKSLTKHLKYDNIVWILADDRSEPGHIEALVEKFDELGVHDLIVTRTNDEHWGLGASLNNALKRAFKITDVVLTTEDDWFLQYDFDLTKYVDVIRNDPRVCTIRLGAINTIQDCLVRSDVDGFYEVSLSKYKYVTEKEHRGNMMLNLQVALRHSRLFKRTGFLPENSRPDTVEYALNKKYLTYCSGMKILWPDTFDTKTLCNETNPFLHFGKSTVGHEYDVAVPELLTVEKTDPDYGVVVSLTSIPRRIHNVKTVLEAMLSQTVLPDLFVLYLNETDFKDNPLPTDLVEFSNDKNNRFEIRWVDENWTSHTKYIFALKDFPRSVIINIDDDLIYENHFIENLLNEYEQHKNEKCLICNFSREIVERNGLFHVSGRATGKSGVMYRPLTGHGTLYPPGVFDGTELFDHDKAMRLTYKHDEWWLWYVCYLHNIPTINTQAYRWDRNKQGQHQIKVLDQAGCLYLTVNSEKREDEIGKAIFKEIKSRQTSLPKLCVVMTATKNMEYQYKYTVDINKRYCDKHGYDFFFDTYDIADEACHYLKKDLILKHLDNYDWVVYMDVDAWFNNFDKKIEDVISKGLNLNASASLIVAKHSKCISKTKTYDLDLVNAGVLVVKNSKDGRQILEDWHTRTPYAKDWLKERTSLHDQPYLCLSIMFNPVVFKSTAVLEDVDMNYFTNRVPKYSKDTYILHASGSNYNKDWRRGMFDSLTYTVRNNNLPISVKRADFV